jgi:hypothetical protein
VTWRGGERFGWARPTWERPLLELLASIEQDDLRPWNVCLADGSNRFIDWGDSCVAHPPLRLSIPLAKVGADHVEAARNAYLETWTAFPSREDLIAATVAAVLLGHITGVLKWVLILSGVTGEVACA